MQHQYRSRFPHNETTIYHWKYGFSSTFFPRKWMLISVQDKNEYNLSSSSLLLCVCVCCGGWVGVRCVEGWWKCGGVWRLWRRFCFCLPSSLWKHIQGNSHPKYPEENRQRDAHLLSDGQHE